MMRRTLQSSLVRTGLRQSVPKPQSNPFQLSRRYQFVNTQQIDLEEARVPVYSSQRFQGFTDADQGQEFNTKVHKSEETRLGYLGYLNYLSLSVLSDMTVGVVVSMELLPNSESMEITYMGPSGIIREITPIKNIRPILWDDFSNINQTIHSYPDENVDLTMIYQDYVQNTYFLFERDGQWNETGVNHESLSVEKNFNERVYYSDHIRSIRQQGARRGSQTAKTILSQLGYPYLKSQVIEKK